MSSPLTHGGRGAAKAFTLIELITVIAIIGVLAGITFGVVRGVGEQAKVNRATSELAVLSAALEEYKRYYGDYPWVGGDTSPNQILTKVDDRNFSPNENDRAYNFCRAMGGRVGPKHDIVKRQIDAGGTMVAKYNRSFVDFALFNMERPLKDIPDPLTDNAMPEPAASPTQVDPDFANAFLDPWGHRYLYYYKDIGSAATWKRPGYVLYSAGPDGKATFPTNAGVMPPTTGEDADNIYATP